MLRTGRVPLWQIVPICLLPQSIKEGARSKNQSRIYAIGNYRLDADYCLLKDAGGKMKTLTKREAGILELFCENKGEVIRREAILSRFWETEDDYFASRSLDVFVTKLRKLFFRRSFC